MKEEIRWYDMFDFGFIGNKKNLRYFRTCDICGTKFIYRGCKRGKKKANVCSYTCEVIINKTLDAEMVRKGLISFVSNIPNLQGLLGELEKLFAVLPGHDTATFVNMIAQKDPNLFGMIPKIRDIIRAIEGSVIIHHSLASKATTCIFCGGHLLSLKSLFRVPSAYCSDRCRGESKKQRKRLRESEILDWVIKRKARQEVTELLRTSL